MLTPVLHMPLKRWIAGLAALPFLILLIVEGGFAFFALVAAAGLLALWEFYRVVFPETQAWARNPVLLSGFVMVPAVIFGTHAAQHPAMMGGLVSGNLLMVALVSLIRFDPQRPETEAILFQILGVVYIALPLSMLVLIRLDPHGIAWIILLLAIVFVGDTCAFHVGSHYGRRKLCPSISPGKTVEGALGGLAGNLVAGSVVKAFWLPQLAWPDSLVFFVLAGVAGQAGDLFESRFKRLANVKDSGSFLPGHGGILDRIDALLFASPVAYLFFTLSM